MYIILKKCHSFSYCELSSLNFFRIKVIIFDISDNLNNYKKENIKYCKNCLLIKENSKHPKQLYL